MTPHRADSIDVLRGMAMLWMTVFHFCFDLSHFGLWPQDFRADPWWTQQRTAIVSLFLLCAGCGQAMALDAGWGWARFARRWGYIVAAAALVTLGSWWMFPQSFIYFGVLHGMAVMLVLVRLLAGAGQHLWWLGAVMLALPWVKAIGLWESAVSAARRDADAGRLPAIVPEFVPGNTLALPRPGQTRITQEEAVRTLKGLLDRCAARRAGKGK